MVRLHKHHTFLKTQEITLIHHLFGRVGRLVRSNFHALIEKIEYSDSKEKISHAMTEIDAGMDELRAEIGRLAAFNHKIRHKRQMAQHRHLELDSQIEAALKANAETEAQAAAAQQLDIESELLALDAQSAQYDEESRDLEVCLSALKTKKEILAKALDQFNRNAAGMDSDRQTVDIETMIDSKSKEKIANADLAFDRIMANMTEDKSGKQSRAGASQQLQELEEIALKTKIEKRLAEAKQRMKKND